MEERAKGYQETEKMIYIIAKKSVWHHEINNINKIKAKASKKRCGDSRNSSSEESYSDSLIYSDSD